MKKNLVSDRQQQFLAEYRRHHRLVLFFRIFILLCFLILWESAAYFGWINDFIFSSPSRLIHCFLQMVQDGSIAPHILVTLTETLLSFLFVILGTILITILLWANHAVFEACEPYMVILNSLPKSALAPLLIVWLGANYRTIIVTGMSVAVFGSILSLYQGFQSVDPDKIKLIETLGGNRRQILWHIILPFNIPQLFSIMKVDIGLCLVGVIIGEFIASRRGLGYLIIYGSQIFKLDWVLMSIFLLCLIAVTLYGILTLIEKKYKAI